MFSLICFTNFFYKFFSAVENEQIYYLYKTVLLFCLSLPVENDIIIQILANLNSLVQNSKFVITSDEFDTSS